MVVRRGGQFLMSEVPLFLFMRGVLQDGDRDLGGKLASAAGSASVLQGYLAQKKTPPPRTLQQMPSCHAHFIGVHLSEENTCHEDSTVGLYLQGYLAHKKQPPTLGPP